ncbi:unnamed protein product, partial [Meganyctiphanes norvegica]
IVRLTPAEENMVLFVTGLLGQNVGNLIPFITHSDANTPPVLEALRACGIDTKEHLVFNNVCLNTTIKGINELYEMYWQDGLRNIQKGIDAIMKLQPITLLANPLKEPSTDRKNKLPHDEGFPFVSMKDEEEILSSAEEIIRNIYD